MRSYYRLQIEFEKSLEAPRFPGGITLRGYQHDQDIVPLYQAYEEAYADHWGHVRQSQAEGVVQIRGWAESTDGLDSGLWVLAMDGDVIAGFLLAAPSQDAGENTGEVWELGVLPRWRRQGVGLALLQHIFREFQRRGRRRAVLDVDTGNASGATRLYELAGMTILTRRTLFEKTLREGKDLRANLGGSADRQ